MKITKKELETACKTCNGTGSLLRYFNLPDNGTSRKKIKLLFKKFEIDPPKYSAPSKYQKITKLCPVCNKQFITLLNYKREKVVCSYSCSNTFFRSGEQNGNYGSNHYRNICFRNHEKKCCICGFNYIVEVHHMDCNKENNDPTNLVPLCPNHHQMFHSKHRHLVESLIEKYISRA